MTSCSKGEDPYLKIYPFSCQFSKEGGTQVIEVETNVQWEPLVTSTSEGWFTVTREGNKLTIVVDEFHAAVGDSRSIYIEFINKEGVGPLGPFVATQTYIVN